MTRLSQMDLEDDRYCFACGMDNADGLRIEWHIQELTTSAEFIPERKFQGWKGVLHGGIIATLLDEAMTRLACEIYGAAVTAEMTVRYVVPIPIGEVVLIRGEVITESRWIIEMKASLFDRAGKTMAYATGKIMKMKKKD